MLKELAGPVEVRRLSLPPSSDAERLFAFNDNAPFVIALNLDLPDAMLILSKLHGALDGYRQTVLLERFRAPLGDNVAIEVGCTLPIPIAVAAANAPNSVRRTVYFVTKGGKFGYTQRAYIGSLSVSGRKIIELGIGEELPNDGGAELGRLLHY